MQIFEYEIQDGLAESISATASISYASIAEPCLSNISNLKNIKSLASLDDADLYYVQSILVSSSWNKNDDIFDKDEVWFARKTPEDKPTNLEHDESTIIGHITHNWPITETGSIIPEDINISDLPDKYHILTGSVIYRAFTNKDLKDRAEKLIADIESGNMFVSMECFFKGFDYGLLDKTTGSYKTLSRNENTAYLTKYLRAYGGTGEHENYKIGRVLRNITFSGKGFVEKPANPDSIIFTKDSVNKLFTEKRDNSLTAGVLNNQLTHNVENIDMSDQTNTDLAIETEASVVSLNEQIAQLQAQVASQAETIKMLETEKEEAAKKAQEKMEQEEQDKEEAAKKMKDEEEKQKEEAAKKAAEDEEKDNENKKLKAELEAAKLTIAEYMQKEEEAAKKEKKMKRKAALATFGLDDASAEAALEKFESLSDEAFDTMTSLFAGKMPPWLEKKDEEKDSKDEKKKASVETVDSSVLENVEVEPTVNLSVGGDSTSSDNSTRAELIDFVCARLGKKLNKGE